MKNPVVVTGVFLCLLLLAFSVGVSIAQNPTSQGSKPTSKAMPWLLLLLSDDEPSTPTLSSLTISGPKHVNETSEAQYTCMAGYSDGTEKNVTGSATWSENSAYASITSTGYLTTQAVTADQSCTITAQYDEKTDTHTITIKNQSIPGGTITITALPTTNSDGNYTLEWSATGLASVPWIVQEDVDTNFTSPTSYMSYDNTLPYTYAFNNKPTGTYCYRVGFSAAGPFSNSACITVSTGPTTIVLNPQYDNQVYINSLNDAVENTVYTIGPLPVGCNWTYSYVMSKQDFVCGQGLVRFNVSTLAGKTIDSAILNLVTSSKGVGFYPRQWHIRALSTSWSPATVTWNIVENLQYYLYSEIVLYPPGYFGQSEVFEIDVTSIVQNWVSGAWNNFGLNFGSEDYIFPYTTSFDAFELFSLEDPGQDWPKLIVTYH